jgi:hypothetical protein
MFCKVWERNGVFFSRLSGVPPTPDPWSVSDAHSTVRRSSATLTTRSRQRCGRVSCWWWWRSGGYRVVEVVAVVADTHGPQIAKLLAGKRLIRTAGDATETDRHGAASASVIEAE